MLSATWPQVAKSVPLDLLFHSTKHPEHENKIASLALKVTNVKFQVIFYYTY